MELPRLTVGVLGPLRIAYDGEPVMVTGHPRTLAAVLAMSAGSRVSVERLVDAVWGEDPPVRTRRAVQLNVCRLRRAMGPERILTVPAGYALRAEPDDVDALRFERLLDRLRTIREAAQRRTVLAQALALWRGPPFEDVPSARLRETESPRLVERYLTAMEHRIDLELAAGRHRAVIADLRDLTARHSLRERFWEQLMLALHRSGRRADALDAYRKLNRRLAEEIGVAPGAAARELHRRILGAG